MVKWIICMTTFILKEILSDQNYLLSRQNDESYGGFKVQDTNLRSNNWMDF